MEHSGFFWFFVIFQFCLDLYVSALVIYWIMQKRKYGTFNPFSPFQHRDIQTTRQLLGKFHSITEKTSHLLEQLKCEQEKIKAEHFVKEEKLVKPEPTLQPVTQPITPPENIKLFRANSRQRTQQIRLMLKQGQNVAEIQQKTGASQEEIHLIGVLI